MSRNLPTLHAPTLPAIDELATLERIAETVSRSQFVPRAYQGKPGDIFAAALYGREFGWSLMVALQYIQVIQGKPTLSAEAMVARIRQLGHSVTAVEWTDTVCTLVGKHAVTGDEETVSFTMDDAQRAGLRGDNWRKYPKAMLRARATTMLARALFADAIMGISYTPEELGSVSADDVSHSEPVREVNATVARNRRRRRGTGGLRCGTCDGYGGNETGEVCANCNGTGIPQQNTETEPVEYIPVATPESADMSELDEALKNTTSAIDVISLLDGSLDRSALTRGYNADDPRNASTAPLSIDLIGHVCFTMGDVGRAESIDEAVDKLMQFVADKPTITNAWAMEMVERMMGES